MDLLKSIALAPTRWRHGRWTRALVLWVAVAGGLACGDSSSVRGIVERVDDGYEQVLLTQPGIEGLLPAGTTTLQAGAAVRAQLEPGQIVEVEVARSDSGRVITAARFVRMADERDGWIEAAGKHLRARRAEPIALSDTQGHRVSLADFSGKLVLLDFIYTSCAGACPAQTQNMRWVQRRLSDSARPNVHLVSVTIDPETDDAARLAEYAARFGADLSGWSFLTGPVAEVEETYARYGIGVAGGGGRSMDHTLRSFVIDDRGYLIDQYQSDAFDPDAVVRRLEALSRVAAARHEH